MPKNKQGYYCVIPHYILEDEDLTDKTKLVYGEISSLVNKEGYCFAKDSHFEKIFKARKRTIQSCIKQLKDKGYISVIYEGKGGSIRKIYLTQKSAGNDIKCKNLQETTQKSAGNNGHNNVYNNTIYNNKNANASHKNIKFSQEEYLKKMEKDKRHIQIIALFFKHKKFRFESQKQIEKAIRRYVRSASQLTEYSNERIEKVMKFLDRNMFDRYGRRIKWTLETVIKYIDEDLIKLVNPNL